MLHKVARRVLSNILCNHLFPYAEKVTGNYQCGFQLGGSTVSQIFTIRQILEKTKEYNISLHHPFIGFQVAYDTITREKLFAAIKEFGYPGKLMRMVHPIMKYSTCSVRVQSSLSAQFGTMNALRQGDVLACLLFNVALEKVIQDSGIQTR